MSEAVAIGQQLRAARERVGLGLVQAAEQLHVDTAVIESLEAGDFAALGAPVFVRGHLGRYADLLGESGQDLQARYAALHESSMTPDLTAGRHLPAQIAQGPRSRWPLVLLAFVLAIAVAVWWATGVNNA